MGRYMGNRKRSRPAAVESAPEIGATVTRASMAKQAVEKKRKIGLGGSEMTDSILRLKTRLVAVVPPEESVSQVISGNSTCDSSGSDRVLASCCSSNGSSQVAKGSTDFVDLEEETEGLLATSGGDIEERRETTPSIEVQADFDELESPAMLRESHFRRRSTKAKMPSEAEIEDFFSAAETKLREQFIDKYNFDIVMDEPLEGRYEWVPVLAKPWK